MISRNIIPNIETWLWKEKILILKWSRQVWKTTIMKFLQNKLEKSWENTIYFNADIELWNDIFESPKNFINFIKTQIWDKKLYIFIDEFQFIGNAWFFLKWIFDELKKDIQLIISWSSSLEITKNSEFLTWRKIDFFIEWISFYEYLCYNSKFSYKKYSIDDIFNINFLWSDIKYNLLDYLNYWNYPEVLTTKNIENKKTILKEIIWTYISKDISWFMKINEISAFNNLLKILSKQSWNLVNKSELSNTLNIDIKKINYFLDILEWTYIIDLISPFFKNIRKEISKMPKIFFKNISVINYLSGNYYSNIDTIEGSIIENFIYNSLCLENFDSIKYYRTISKSEIDFIVSKDNKLIPIEVKFRNKIWWIPVAIKNFEENYKNIVSKKIIVTKDDFSKSENLYKIPFYLLPLIDFNL